MNSQTTDTRRDPSLTDAHSFAVDVFESKTDFLLVADLPGVAGQDLDVSFEDGELTITATRPETSQAARFYGNRLFGAARRTFSLPETVDASRIEATYKHGVLTLKLPKAEQAKARRVPVLAS